jgi:hypothetical protein
VVAEVYEGIGGKWIKARGEQGTGLGQWYGSKVRNGDRHESCVWAA